MRKQHVAVAAACAVAVAALSTAPATGGTTGGPGPRGQVTLDASPDALELVPLPCLTAGFQATMTNTGQQDRFADMTLTAQEPVTLSRDVFSTYLPAAEPDQPVSAAVEVGAPRDTPPGTYDIRLAVERQELHVPVRVLPTPPKGPGDNLALGEQAFASSTHGNFGICGGVDGNTDHAQWDTRTGWNDATPAAFPDHYGVRFPEPRRIDRVDVLTLDGTAYPAARYGLRDWDVQVLGGGQWQTVAEVRGNGAGAVTSRFAPVTAEAVRIVVHASNDARYSRVMELEVREEQPIE